MAFIFITYSFYFNFFYLILLLQKIITSSQKGGGWGVGGRLKPHSPPAPLGLLPYTSSNDVNGLIKNLEEASKELFKWCDDNLVKSNP